MISRKEKEKKKKEMRERRKRANLEREWISLGWMERGCTNGQLIADLCETCNSRVTIGPANRSTDPPITGLIIFIPITSRRDLLDYEPTVVPGERFNGR